MKISPMKNYLLTADLIGKIKLVEFPNVYKMANVFLYNDEDIKFCDFLNSQNIIVLTSNYEVHLWSLFDFQIKNKFDLKEILDLKVTKKSELQLKGKNKENHGEKKDYDNTQEHERFLRDDENFKDILFLEGNKILFELRSDIDLNKSAKISINSKSFICLEISNDDQITHKNLNKLSQIKMEDNFYFYINDNGNNSNSVKEVVILELINDQNLLKIIERIEMKDI